MTKLSLLVLLTVTLSGCMRVTHYEPSKYSDQKMPFEAAKIHCNVAHDVAISNFIRSNGDRADGRHTIGRSAYKECMYKQGYTAKKD